jgi:acyl-CoA synthetase (AMP-forming)/AMP-acid ligase II
MRPQAHVAAMSPMRLALIDASAAIPGVGGVNLLIPNPRDIGGFIKELQKYQANLFPAVNTLHNALLQHPEFEKVDFSKFKVCLGSGMAVQRPVAEAWLKVTGCALCEGYGLSETSPGLTCNPADIDHFTGSIGLPVPSTYISIRNDEGRELPLGEAGEICAKGPQVMAGYWNRPEETAKAMTSDGYFCIGDIGIMSADGFLKIVDRKKDMILVSGFNVQRLRPRSRSGRAKGVLSLRLHFGLATFGEKCGAPGKARSCLQSQVHCCKDCESDRKAHP